MPIRFESDLPNGSELVIIGGGVVGAATAFYASRAGLRPLILERRPALATLTTPASTGAFRLQFDNEEELLLVRETVALLDGFQERTGQREFDLGLRRQGYLWATTSAERAEEQRRLVVEQHGWGQRDIEVLDGHEVRRRFPYLASDVIQARFRAGDGFLDPKQLALGLVAGSKAEVVVRCGALRVLVEAGRVTGVETTRGTVSADRVVIAAGPFSGEVSATAGVHLPIEAVIRHKVVLPDVPEVPQRAPMIIDDDTGAHWRPALRGAFLLYTDPATPPGPPLDDVPPEAGFAFRLLDPSSPVSVARISPFWGEVWRDGSAHWVVQSGQYDMTPDHRPLLGSTGIGGLFVNAGYSGHGIMGSPAGSRHLVDVMTGKIAEADNPFRLDRQFEPRATDVL